MKICKETAMRLWEEHFGSTRFAEDFHGNLMCKDGYGDPAFFIYEQNGVFINYSRKIYCGWNIHHIMPVALGGTNEKRNLLCTNIATNAAAEDKITFWIDDTLYQVKRIPGARYYKICRLDD